MATATGTPPQLAGPDGDLRLFLQVLEESLIALIEHPERLTAVRSDCEENISDELVENIGSSLSMVSYVKENWATICTAHGETPLIEFLSLRLCNWALRGTSGTGQENSHQWWLDTYTATNRLFRAAVHGDSKVASAQARLNYDLSAFKQEERAHRWLNDLGD